ncbi:alpha/beta hydrolase-fold protein [Flavobacteriaceae bacterium]|nr:alpha/beta hydrolase-fold protein [Flavobacteriaceae bacterium]
MKPLYLFFVVLGTLCSSFAQTGKVMDELKLNSKILKGERKFAVYLPPDYETSSRSYPVLYLLHGYTDDQTGWVQFGEVQHITDKAINEGTATPMIIIMPDADTGLPGYTNALSGNWNYEDFFFEEFMPYVEGRFRIKKKKQFRAVAGLSMGGGGSFLYALHRPDLFSSAAPLSASLGPQRLDEMNEFAYLGYTSANHNKKDFEIYSNRNNQLRIVDQLSKETLNSVRWYIDCGDDDFLYEANSLMHIKLRKKGVNHEFRIRDGGHTWTYWRTALPSVLAFISERFHQ